MPELNTTLGNGRFLLTRKLGVGGMGSVYEALDSKRNVSVALKSLGQIDPLAVGSFKAEFRDFQHLHHPNLVVLDEFFNEGDEWYFTMELLAGRDFLSCVRQQGDADHAQRELPTELASSPEVADHVPRHQRVYPGSLDLPALRGALRQLTAALSHLHAAGKVHRDVKSSNVLVDATGRVTLLDFGVAVDVKGKGVQLAGTPLYMAPELFWNSATPAADWYSAGIILYQALTGTDPWQQSSGLGALLTTKRAPPEHPADLNPDVPEDLAELCMSLLVQNPRERAGRRAILEWLDQDVDSPAAANELPDDEEPETFVGRTEELRQLRASFTDLATHQGPLVIFVHGESGIGKSALVDEFTKNLHLTERATVLRGRVLEEEVVPYKSVDGIVDALGEHFLELGYQRVQPLLPDDFNIVSEVFPILRRSPAVAELPRTKITQPTERRLRMFAALKECLRRLAEIAPLVVTVEDLQWSDADGLQLWNEIVQMPGAPRMLLIATLRLDRSGSIRPSRKPPSMMPASLGTGMPRLPTPTRSLWLSRLSDDEARAYVAARTVGRHRSVAPDDIVHEATGHPLFIDELLRYRGTGIGSGQLTLDAVLRERVDQLDEEQKRYLTLVCVSAKPLSRSLVAKAAGISHGQGLRAVKALRASRLVRTGRPPGADGDDWVDAFHYRVRNACIEAETEESLADLHRAIAVTMEGEGKLDAEQLAIEWREAGETAKAAVFSEQAGDGAFAAVAFQKAAEFYSDALALVSPTDTATKVRLRERLARSLRNAGRAKAAADVLDQLASDLLLESGFEYRREAVELLLRSGYVDEALAAARVMMAAVGERIPVGDHRALASLAWGRARIAVTRHRWKPRRRESCPASELRRLDALWSLSFGLGSIEQLPSFALCARYALGALTLGEPARVAKAFAVEAMTSAAGGGDADAREHAAEARRAASLVPDAAADLAVVWSADALALVMSGSWRDALRAARYAQERIVQDCVGAVGEWSMAVEAELWALGGSGAYDELYRAANSLNQRGVKTEDLYAQIAAVSGLPNIGWLARDQAERAIEVTSAITARWSQRGVHIQHLFDAYARAQAYLYRGDSRRAANCFADFDRQAKGKLILVPHMMRVFRAELEGRIALARLFAGETGQRGAVRKHVKQLYALDAPWAVGLALLLEAGLLHAAGDLSEAARTARSASSRLGEASMSGYVMVATAYAARVVDDRQPNSAELAALGVVDSLAFTRLLAPGFMQFH